MRDRAVLHHEPELRCWSASGCSAHSSSSRSSCSCPTSIRLRLRGDGHRRLDCSLLPSASMMLFAGPARRLARPAASVLRVPPDDRHRADRSRASSVLAARPRDHAARSTSSSALLGLGIGFSFAAMANLIVEPCTRRKTGVATGINTIMRTIGGSLGGQIAATHRRRASWSRPRASRLSQGFTLAFALSAGVMVFVAFLAALAIPKTSALCPGAPAPSEASARNHRLARLDRLGRQPVTGVGLEVGGLDPADLRSSAPSARTRPR